MLFFLIRVYLRCANHTKPYGTFSLILQSTMISLYQS